MLNYKSFFDANRTSWNKRTAVHKDSAFYDLESFKNGQSSLNKIELRELGNVQGKTLLHLQCHFGMDTLSWAREGAIVTGVDLSDEAIKLATDLNNELAFDATFVCSNIYDLIEVEGTAFSGKGAADYFDIVFTSYGTIGWLPDLDHWAKVIAHFLKPGGTFYIVDFHPVLWMMDENFQEIKYDYFNTSVIAEEHIGTYTDKDAPIKSMEYSWNHSFSEILAALLKYNLNIVTLNEYPYSPYNCFNNLEQGIDKMWRIKNMNEKLPMIYSIKAVKQV